MTIVNRTIYPVATSLTLIARMQTQFDTLQNQLASGQKASNLAELDTQRYFDLSIRARKTQLEGYSNSIDMVNTRLDAYGQATTALTKLLQDQRKAITPSTYGSNFVNFGTVPSLARAGMDQLVDILNTDVNGRYLFSGSQTDKIPVQGTSALLDGSNGAAGFKQVALEREQADIGANGLGRLNVTAATPLTPLTISEDDAPPFGFKIGSINVDTASVPGPITVTETAADPLALPPVQHNFAVQVDTTTAPLTNGDTISLRLTMPDGTNTTVVLTAVSDTPDKPGEFQIDPTGDDTLTTTNLQNALTASLTTTAHTELVAASNNQAANEFFNGVGQSQYRVDASTGTPPGDIASATALVAASPNDTTTVHWYAGGDDPDPRSSVQAKVDDTRTVNYGAQANESGTANLMRSLAVLAIQNFTPPDPASADPNPADPYAKGVFDGLADRNLVRVSASYDSTPGSIPMVGVELGNAQVALKDLSDRHTQYSAQLNTMISDIEAVDDNDVSMQIMQLQTRMQASYAAASMISQLSLVNFLK